MIPLVLALATTAAVARAQPASNTAGEPVERTPLSIADLTAMERQVQATLAKVTPSVVGVSEGSGVVISEDGYVLTVAHVGERAGRDVTITFPDGRKVKAKTLGNDYGVDAGLAKIAGNGPWPHAEMGDSGSLKPGQWCLALGYPVSFDREKAPVARIGRVLRGGPTMVITDATIMGGDSGCPLFDLEGKVVGIGSRCDDRLTTNIYVPVDRFRDSWERLAKGDDFNSRRPDVAFLGVSSTQGAEDARIDRVIPGSAAEKAGIAAGDIILKFDGHEVTSYDDLPPLVRKRKPGDKVEIELRRSGKTLQVQATLGKQSG